MPPLHSLRFMGRSARRFGVAAFALVLIASPSVAAQLDLGKGRDKKDRDKDIVLPRRREPVREPVVPTVSEPSVLAATLLEDLVSLSNYDESRSKLVAAQWAALGEDGLRAARAGLTLDGVMPIVTSARVLAGFGTEQDRALLNERMGDSLPRNSVAPLISAMRRVRPPYLNDQRLVDLLSHRQASVRTIVERELRSELDGLGDLVEELGEEAVARRRTTFGVELTKLLDSERSDTRSRALELLMRTGQDLGQEAAMRGLRDRSARVASQAVELLADLPSEMVAEPLVELAFSTGFLYRDQAYAVLALIEIEEGTGTAWIGEEHVPMLLESLRSSDLLASGAAALALSGVGFRGTMGNETDWYDLEVPHALVRAVSGDEFHQDIGPIAELARRRLLVVTGQDFGPDGPAWRAWWTENVRGFRARRAGIELGEEDISKLVVRLFDNSQGLARVELLGPDAPASAEGVDGFRLNGAEVAELSAELHGLELLDPTRLPGRFGTGGSERTLEIESGRQAKRFTYASAEVPAWFEQAVGLIQARVEDSRWQLFLISPEAAEEARRGDVEEVRARWDLEAAWWQEDHPQLERDRRVFGLALEGLVSARGLNRERRVRELVLLQERSDVVEPADFANLLRAIEREVLFGERTQLLVELALEAALQTPAGANAAGDADTAAPGDGQSSGDQAPAEVASIDDASLDRARELFDSLHQDFQETGSDGLAIVVERAGLRLARELVFDTRPTARQLAADSLGAAVSHKDCEPQDLDLFELLLGDPDPRVEIAALQAVEEHNLKGFLPEVLARSRAGAPPVRAAALLAAGKLGGTSTLDLLVSALASSELEVQQAAVRALGSTGASDSGPILLSILSRGDRDPLVGAAAEALANLGKSVWPDLMRSANTPNAGGRRRAALLLARGGAAQAVGPLIDLLTLDPGDKEVARELALLTLVDFQGQQDPAGAWWDFVEATGELDDLVWLRRAQERASIPPTPFGSLGGEGTRSGAYSLWRSLGAQDELIVVRCHRELNRLFGGDLEPLPAVGRLRDEWRSQLLERIDSRYADF